MKLDLSFKCVLNPRRKTSSGVLFSGSSLFFPFRLESFPTSARKYNGPVSLVEFRIETGRMHQIRIHAAELGCPVVGDRTYGDAAKDRRLRARPARHLLHAVELSFLHPTTHRRVTFSTPPPADLVYAG